MRDWKYFTLVIALMMVLAIAGCGEEEAAEPEAQAETEAVATDVIPGDTIETGVADDAETVTDETPDEREVTGQPEDGQEEDGDATGIPDTKDSMEPEPIEGEIKIGDLVYPVIDIITGDVIKEPVDGENFISTTQDPFEEVFNYYLILLSMKETMIDRKESTPMGEGAKLIARDEFGTWYVSLIEMAEEGTTMIDIGKG